MDVRISSITLALIAIQMVQFCQGKESEKAENSLPDNFLLVNDAKTHFACRTKVHDDYKLLSVERLCDGVGDCLEDADETADGCKRKEKILVQTTDDSKKQNYVSEFKEAIGRALRKADPDTINRLMNQFDVFDFEESLLKEQNKV